MKRPTVTWTPARIKRMYRAGKNVSQIAVAIGYAKGTGNNRVRNFLAKAGLYKSSK
jgi:DNA-binding NarL/FixJ family response regulator